VTTNETTLREVGAGGGEVLFSWTDGKQDEGAGHGVAVGSLNHPRHAGLDPVVDMISHALTLVFSEIPTRNEKVN